MAPELRPGSVIRADWFAETADPLEDSGLAVVVRAWLAQAGLLAWADDSVVLSCPQSLPAPQAAQDSHPDNVMAIQTRPVKAIPGFVPIGFSFLHG